jgi:MoaA/NifB/PqqE/SkfB family radical SAM enzyme
MITKKKEFGGIILNPYCSLSCVFCGGHKKSTDMEIREQEVKAYKNLQYLKNEGIKKISISGSDPLEYEEIAELISYLKKEGFEFVQLSTNGVRLSDPSFLNKLILSGVDQLRIPLYGSNAEIHDSVTRTPGSFDKLLAGIKSLLSKNVKIEIQISCLILEQNKNDLLNIVDFVNGLGIKNFYFSIPCLTEDDISFYIPFKDLGPYVKKLYSYALKINDKITFLEIPFCVFGELNTKNINNVGLPPNLGKFNQPPEKVRTSIPDLPSYRLKRKVGICNSCKASNHCDGFFVNDVDRFGIGNLQPIK